MWVTDGCIPGYFGLGIDRSLYGGFCGRNLQIPGSGILQLLMIKPIITSTAECGTDFYSVFGLFYPGPMNSGAANTCTIDTYVCRGRWYAGDVGDGGRGGGLPVVVSSCKLYGLETDDRQCSSSNALFGVCRK